MFDHLDQSLSVQAVSAYRSSSAGLDKFRVANNAAAAQVDYVGYSAGGVLVREFGRNAYSKTQANFGEGIVHKVITLGSPHFGSDWLQGGVGNLSSFCKTVAVTLIGFHDKNPDIPELTPNSIFLNAINDAPAGIPVYAIAGTLSLAQDLQFNLTTFDGLAVLALACPGITSVDSIFGIGRNDGIVSELSARANSLTGGGISIAGRTHTLFVGAPDLVGEDRTNQFSGTLFSNSTVISQAIQQAIDLPVWMWRKL